MKNNNISVLLDISTKDKFACVLLGENVECEDFELESRRVSSGFEASEENFQIDENVMFIDTNINDLPF